MKMKYYFKRIINNKIKLGVFLLIMAFPIYDIYMIIKEIGKGQTALDPNIASFLSSSIFNSAQILLLWYLPLYFLILAADDCIEDHKLGYKNLLVAKWGKRSYFRTNIIKGFLIGFFAILTSLSLNLILTQIAFAGGTDIGFDSETIETLDSLRVAFEHPFLRNIECILLLALIAGIVSMGAVAMGMALRNRLLVYPIVFSMWYIPSSTFERPIMLAVDPFSEYTIQDCVPSIIFAVGINLAAVAFAYIKEIKYEQV
ncbi:MAG: DUF2705 family protein [Clostridia bacterium]|nr:DUF2705 family protein [Clostridia bacterium]